MILDGWGRAAPGSGNAVELADTPTFDRLLATWPQGTLDASGAAVGLPAGQMGNSEVGHLNIGAGRVVYQDLTRIDKAIADGAFFANPVLRQAFATARERRAPRSICWASCPTAACTRAMGHLKACLEMARREGVDDVAVHAFLDGRDTPPHSSPGFLAEIERVHERERRRPVRHGQRPLLRHGPRHPLGTRRAGLRRACLRSRRAGAQRPGRRVGRLRARRDRRVRATDRDRRPRRAPGARRRRLPVLQLPSGPGPRAHARLLRGVVRRIRPRPASAAGRVPDDDPLQEGVPAAGRLWPRAGGARAGRGAGRSRPAPAPHRRDREVRPRDLLLQRRRRARLSRRASHPRAEPARRGRPTTTSRR